MFENWAADQIDDAELAKNHAYLLGSFWNPEAVKKLIGDQSNTRTSSEAAFDASAELVKSSTTTKKRKRRKLRN